MKKIFVLLLHGTWAGSARWTHFDSPMRLRLEEQLKELGYEDVDVQPFPWNGENRWNARNTVTAAINEYLDGADRLRPWSEWDFLIVAHSHGGNIAVDAVRDRMERDPDCPIRGVVCLNTPFLTRQLKSSNGYLLVWTVLSIALGAAIIACPPIAARSALPSVLQLFPYVNGVGPDELSRVLLSVGSATGLLYLISKVLHALLPKPRWKPRPNVLCLSCPDDEAITLLGLGEGIANLPQLLLHPIAVPLLVAGSAFLGFTWGGLSHGGQASADWIGYLGLFASMVASWLTIALVGGLLGTTLVSFLFGLSIRQSLESLVSRVLVSYSPLRSANSYFRGISDISLKISLLPLVHSQIYESPQTVEDICDWLHQL